MPDVPTPAPREATPAAPGPPPGGPVTRIVVRPMPKIVFFYLTWLASLACGVLSSVLSHAPAYLGTIWLLVFTLNLLVISFDFTEMVSVAVGFAVLAFVLGGLYFGFLSYVGDFLSALDPRMNPGFYFSVFGVFSVLYGIVFVKSRFDYWEFRNNEVLHRSGMFSEIKRYSTEDLRWFKEIPDVLERILLGSGRMVLTTPREPNPIVIQHVIGIERVDERIAELLGTKRVTLK